MVGIVSYGTYIPKYRIKLSDIASVWNKNGADVERSLKVTEKSVPGADEDTVTMALEAARGACAGFSETEQIECVLVGSESHPYAVNPTSTIVGEFLNIGNHYLAADLEFACKAGTAAMQLIAGLVTAKKIKYGLAIGADTAQCKPHDALEYTAAAGSAAFIVGQKNSVAKLLDFTSYSSDTPDFWRREGNRFPEHAGRFSGEPAYFSHITHAANQLIKKNGIDPKQIDHALFHMPNGKFPRDIARRLGFSPSQLALSLVGDRIGNAYSATTLLGLASILDEAKPGQTIFMVSYGSGAGSDAFLWEVTEKIINIQNTRTQSGCRIKDQIERKTYIDYPRYLQQTHMI